MKLRLGLVMMGLVVGLLGGVGYASAAKPVVQGCVGESVSGNAQAIPQYGQVVSSVAKDATGLGGPGVGDEVQAVQAGGVPDTVFPNTCNG
jgi:hypothetical protein